MSVHQEIPTGYKWTEAGVIPQDWEVVSLGNFASFRTGPFGSALHKSDYVRSGVPVINPMHIVGGRLQPTLSMSITSEAQHRLSDYAMRAGDIVIGRRGDMGRCAVVEEPHTGWICGTGSMLVRTNNANPAFLQRILSNARTKRAIENASVGTTMVNLNQGTLAALKVPFPPMAEQHAIAEALGDVDALLDALDRLITKKRALKQAAMQQLLTGRTRLPGFTDEWQVWSLGDLCGMKAGEGITAARITSSGPYACYGGNGLRGYTTTFTHDGDYVLIGRQGALCGNVTSTRGKFYASEHALVVTPGPLVNVDWLSCMLESMKLNQYSESSAQPGLSAVKLQRLELLTPPTTAEQTAIATALSDMDAEIAAFETRRAKTRTIKQAMMQELLTGRTRLINPRTAADAVTDN